MDEKRENLKLHIIIWITIIIMIAVSIWSVFATIAIIEDSNDESITHTDCKITDKESHFGKQGTVYRIESTCGNWFTHETAYNELKMGKSYNLETTKGNWAHQPYLRGLASKQ